MSYQYDAQSPMIINRLSIDIPAGQRVAVVGECGAGKAHYWECYLATFHQQTVPSYMMDIT